MVFNRRCRVSEQEHGPVASEAHHAADSTAATGEAGWSGRVGLTLSRSRGWFMNDVR